jgi:DNA gyrase subunit B
MTKESLTRSWRRRNVFHLVLAICACRFLACISWSSTSFLSSRRHRYHVNSGRKNTVLSSTASIASPSSYEAAQITVLEGLEAVRQRPGMYVGSTGPDGLHQLMWEVVDNSVDEHLAGFASLIEVYIHKDGRTVTVSDNGRGIPVDIHPSTGKSALETCLTVLHAGGKFNSQNSQNNSYRVSGGLHGVGISVVNALSSHVRVEVARNQFVYSMEFSKGKPTTTMQREESFDNQDHDDKILGEGDLKIRWTPTSGTRVTFLPDDDIFKTWQWDHNRLLSRLEEITFLNPDLTIVFTDERQKSSSKALEGETGHVKTLHHAGGLLEYMQLLCQGKEPLLPEQLSSSSSTLTLKKAKTQKKKSAKSKDQPVSLIAKGPLAGLLDEKGTVFCKGVTTSSGEQIALSVALRWSADQYTESILSFVNNIRTKDGGTHVEGLKSCITRTINTLTKKSGSSSDDGSSSIPGEYIREGLTAILSVQVPEPEFEGQTKTRLGNPHVRHAVEAIVSKELCKVFDWQPELLHLIVNKATMAQKAAQAAKAARDVVRRKTLLASAVLPGKLSDCASRDPTLSEIFIVEGDSAAGSAKQGRDRRTQAILPLRGKILNIERASADKIYQNNELQGLISALGLGVKGSNFEKKSLRYHRIIIMTDAGMYFHA